MKVIDAEKKSLGRVATEAAMALMGKDQAGYEPNKVGGKVHVTNVSKLNITEKKLKEKIYQTYSGYPGGQKEKTMEEVIAKKGHGEIMRKAIRGMLPSNRLRDLRLKNLKITE
jgi:large subunit ribosomal protein L13